MKICEGEEDLITYLADITKSCMYRVHRTNEVISWSSTGNKNRINPLIAAIIVYWPSNKEFDEVGQVQQ